MFPIRRKLILVISGIVLLVAGGLTVSTATLSTKLLGEMSKQQLKSATLQSSSTLNAFFDVRMVNLQTWANNVVVTGLVREAAMAGILDSSLRSAFKEVAQREPWLKQMFIINEGDVLFTFNEDLIIKDPFIENIKQLNNSFNVYSGIDIFETQDNSNYAILSAIIANNTEIKATIYFILELNKIQEFLFSKAKIGQFGFVSLLSQNHNKWISTKLESNTIEIQQFLDYQKNLKNFPEQTIPYQSLVLDGKISNFDKISVISVASLRDIEAPVQMLIRSSVGIGVIALLVGLFLAIFLAKRLSKPILLLAEQVNLLAQGNWNIFLNIQTNDEIESLSHNFKNMAS